MATKKAVGYAKYRLSPLKKITDLAKQIRKKNPKMKYTDAVKKAGAQYRSVKTAKPAAKKKPIVKKKAAVKKYKAKRMAKASSHTQGKLFGVSSVGNAQSNPLKQIATLQVNIQGAEGLIKIYRERKKTVKMLSERHSLTKLILENQRFVSTMRKQIQLLKKHIK